MEKPFPGSYPGSKRKLTMNILQPALLVPLFSSLYSGASLTPLSPTVPEGNGNAILLPLADPRAMVTFDIASIPPREGTDTSVTPPLLQPPTAMATSTFTGCRAVSDTPAKRVGSRPTMTCWSAISTVPVIATGILAWQFALDGQKHKGILLLCLVPGRPARRQCNERRLP